MPAVRLGKCLLSRHVACEQSLHERPIHNHRHAVLAAPRHDLRFDSALQHVEWQLARGQRAGSRKLLQLCKRHIRHSHGLGFARLEQSREFGGGVCQRDRRIGGVKVEEIERINGQSPQAFLDFNADSLGPSVHLLLPARLPVDATLAGNHHITAPPLDRGGDRPFALPAFAVAVGCVKVRDARIDRRSHGVHCSCVCDACASHARQRPAAQTKRANPDRSRANRARCAVHCGYASRASGGRRCDLKAELILSLCDYGCESLCLWRGGNAPCIKNAATSSAASRRKSRLECLHGSVTCV